MNSEQVYVVVLTSISLFNLKKRKLFKDLICLRQNWENLALSVLELDVVIEAAKEEDEKEVSFLIFSRTLSTFSETSVTFSAVD